MRLMDILRAINTSYRLNKIGKSKTFLIDIIIASFSL